MKSKMSVFLADFARSRDIPYSTARDRLLRGAIFGKKIDGRLYITAKPTPKKSPSKKASPKKSPLKKAVPKKATPKKVTPKKVTPKKIIPKKTIPKKATPKKATPKKATPKKATPKKATPKKATPKKATPKKATSKKAALEKAVLKKAEPKKPAPKKSPSKKPSPATIIYKIPSVRKIELVNSLLPSKKKMVVPRDIVEAIFETEITDLERKLKKAVERLTGLNYASTYRLHGTKDFIIDADLVIDIYGGIDISDALTDLVAACPNPVGFFRSVGFHLPYPDHETDTGVIISKTGGILKSRRKGSSLRTTSSYFSSEKRDVYVLDLALIIYGNLERKGHKAPNQIFIRLNWNPFLIIPTRSDSSHALKVS
jgi:hypothetical protein